MGKLYEELKRRKVFRVAAVYAVVAWVLIQIADTLFPALQLPQWTVTFITVMLILGFLPILIAAWAYELTPEGIRPDHQVQASPGKPTTSTQPINYLILLIVLVMAGVQLGQAWVSSDRQPIPMDSASTSANSSPLRASIDLGYVNLPQELQFEHLTTLDFMPDGNSFIYTSVDETGTTTLYQRYLDRLEPQIIVQTRSHIYSPVVSPDGERIAYATGPGPFDLEIVGTNGGAPRRIAEGLLKSSLSWLDNETLIYTRIGNFNIETIPATGGEARLVATRGGPGLLVLQRFELLPGSRFMLATVPLDLSNTAPRVLAFDPETNERIDLLENAMNAKYSPTGHLVFVRDTDLWGVPFDVQRLTTTGSEQLLVNDIESQVYRDGTAVFDISANGQLIYLSGTDISRGGEKRLVWLNRDGTEQTIELATGHYEDPVIDPTGTRLAVTLYTDGLPDIWTHRFAEPGIINRVTNTGMATDPLWTPDGLNLIFRQVSDSQVDENFRLGIIDASGIGIIETYLETDAQVFPRAFSSDDSLLLAQRDDIQGVQGVYEYTSSNLDLPRQSLVATEVNEFGPSISPDRNWLAYTSNETGENEIYVRPYPNLGDGKWRVSIDSGHEPKWGRTPGTLHFVTQGRSSIVTVAMQLEPDFAVLERETLDIGTIGSSGVPFYAVGETDDEFLIMRSAFEDTQQEPRLNFGQEPLLVVLVNDFFSELREKVPSD